MEHTCKTPGAFCRACLAGEPVFDPAELAALRAGAKLAGVELVPGSAAALQAQFERHTEQETTHDDDDPRCPDCFRVHASVADDEACDEARHDR